MKHFFSLMRGGQAALLILLWLAGPAARAQAPAWARLGTGVPVTSGAYSYVNASATDVSGNVYLAGVFSGTVSFGTTVLIGNATANGGSLTGFVAKWNSATGTFVWAVGLGGTGGAQATAIGVSNGSVYVGGAFSGTTATFGPFSLTNASATGGSDAFVAKLADAGTTASFVWAQQAGGTGTDIAVSLAVSGSSVYLTGTYASPTFTAGSTVLTNATSITTDTFVAKLSDAGTTASFTWALGFGGSGADEARALAFSGGNLYVFGDFSSPSFNLGNTALANAAGSTGTATDVFLAKLADAGPTASVVWAQRAGGTGSESGDAIALSGTSLYVAGSFSGATTSVGTFILANTSSSANTSDVFVAKFADAGAGATVTWAQASGGIGTDRPKGVAVRGTNVYMAGYYGYPTATFGTTVLTNRGTGTGGDIFVAKLTDSGPNAAVAWAQSAGGLNGEAAFSVALTGNSVVAAGGAAPGATFGPLAIPPGSTVAASFVASLTDPTLTATTAAQSNLSFSLAPNPARAATTVLLPALPGTATATLTLRDALGRTLRTETVRLLATGLHHELDLSGLAPGIYAVQVQAGAATATRRLLVE